MSHVEAMSEIAVIIYRYSTAMDTRQWHLMDDFFTPDAIGDLGGLVCTRQSGSSGRPSNAASGRTT